MKVENEDETQDTSSFIDQFSTDLALAGLTYEKTFIKRFTASCQTKPFVVLTGLSGSGKTKLAQAFARWLTPKSKAASDPFYIGAEINGDRTVYRVTNADRCRLNYPAPESGMKSEEFYWLAILYPNGRTASKRTILRGRQSSRILVQDKKRLIFEKAWALG